jgi:hypothetical protein
MKTMMLVCALLLPLNAKGIAQQPAARKAEQATTKASSELEGRIAKLETAVEMLEAKLLGQRGIQNDIPLRVPSRGAFLDCDSGGYSESLPDNGHLLFLISCETVEPYLEGYRITLAIGNPHSVSFKNAKGTFGYGEELYEAVVKQKISWSTTDQIRSGAWNRVQVTINPASAKDLRNTYVRFEVETASLTR